MRRARQGREATDFVSTPTYPTRHTRQFEENLPRGAVPGRIWRLFVFVAMLQKELQTSAEKESLNRPIPFPNFFESGTVITHLLISGSLT